MAGTAGTRFLYAAPRAFAEGKAALNAEVISGDAGTTCLAAPLSTNVWKDVMLLPSCAHLTWVLLRKRSTKETLARAGPGMEKLPCFFLKFFGFFFQLVFFSFSLGFLCSFLGPSIEGLECVLSLV